MDEILKVLNKNCIKPISNERGQITINGHPRFAKFEITNFRLAEHPAGPQWGFVVVAEVIEDKYSHRQIFYHNGAWAEFKIPPKPGFILTLRVLVEADSEGMATDGINELMRGVAVDLVKDGWVKDWAFVGGAPTPVEIPNDYIEGDLVRNEAFK